MAPLDAPVAIGAMSDVHMKATHERADRRDVLLVLGRNPIPLHAASTVRTAVRKRCLVGLVDP